MPNRSTRDDMQDTGILHRFAQSLHLAPRDDDSATPAPAPAATPAPKTGIAGAAQKLTNAPAALDKAIDDAS
jgi:hypothetical protein